MASIRHVVTIRRVGLRLIVCVFCVPLLFGRPAQEQSWFLGRILFHGRPEAEVGYRVPFGSYGSDIFAPMHLERVP